MLGPKKIGEIAETAEQLRVELTDGVNDLRRTLAIVCLVSVTGLLLASLALTLASTRGEHG